MRNPAQARRDGAVPAEFDRAAAWYDRLVAADPGYHRRLRRSARRLGLPRGGAGLLVLDVGCGTGASTAALARVLPRARIVGVDASAGMLAVARRKPWPPRVRFVRARAEELSPAVVGGAADAVFAAYLLRNCPDPDATLAVLGSLLRPGGRMALHEYSVADSRPARWVWSAVCWCVIIPAGRLLTGRAALHRYLWRSVLEFDGVGRLLHRLRAGGWADVRALPLPGWARGITHTFLARRPGSAAAPVGGSAPGSGGGSP
ncbi:methyltransferase domain-containing protein [Marinitenerispora sediminis]|uniref:Ubiquinone biosynthesis methyltransferase UbiE n=1 Tax=Marinitenerispora sediminis TaxID=1931232 RepID=A0A368T0G8_9ACTN|nr:methyltransferase domain-containing protein [Marinitenerispora sediminis]RCV49800.1 ubiquinone biosynthesis methyltransferase UbiE [Marinitenerispora sediminis]RCV52653.1 ubiquinone biosynthesis methyltransferase UbiE [Marinitenerispora sediminis]RCV55757.1 ubiquinone biosynthesis methyltransferase UbiE [Marinitenerispora sediminis]